MRLPLTRSSRWSGSVSMEMRPVMAVVDVTASLWPCASLMLTVLASAAGGERPCGPAWPVAFDVDRVRVRFERDGSAAADQVGVGVDLGLHEGGDLVVAGPFVFPRAEAHAALVFAGQAAP